MSCVSKISLVIVSVLLFAGLRADAQDLTPALRCVPAGLCFCVRPAFEPAIADKIKIVSGSPRERTHGGQVGCLLPIWFDGSAVEPGDFADLVAPGNSTTSCG